MSKVTFKEEASAPATPGAGYVTFYAKTDGKLYFKDDTGTEYPVKPTGGGTGDLLSDGSVALAADWDVGAFTITALRFISDVATGTAPFTVASTTVVANLNADLLDGNEATAFATAAQGATADAAVAGTLFDANTILKADADNTPLALTVAEQTLVGRITAGSIAALTATQVRTLLNVENGATADQSDVEIETAYNNQVAAASQVEMEAGTETAIRRMTPERVAQAIAALAPSGAVEFADSDWRVTGSVDATKKVAFEVDGLTTATTRTVTMPDEDMSPTAAGVSFEGKKYVGVNDQTGTSYELVISDAGKLITMSNASANTLTIPANASVAFDVGTRIDVLQKGAGATSIAITSDTLQAATGTDINAQWEVVSLIKIAATEWVMVGGVA